MKASWNKKFVLRKPRHLSVKSAHHWRHTQKMRIIWSQNMNSLIVLWHRKNLPLPPTVCCWGCQLLYSRCRPYQATSISLSRVNRLGDDPSTKCDRCACARFRAEWRAATTHHEIILSLSPVSVIQPTRSEHRVAPHQARPAARRSSHKSANVLSACSRLNSFATHLRRYCHIRIFHSGK
jgi:hypothetical protein